jgi:hypothetical protein
VDIIGPKRRRKRIDLTEATSNEDLSTMREQRHTLWMRKDWRASTPKMCLYVNRMGDRCIVPHAVSSRQTERTTVERLTDVSARWITFARGMSESYAGFCNGKETNMPEGLAV